MKFTAQHLAVFSLIFALHFSCKQQDDTLPGKGNATFSMSPINRTNGGGRIEQNETPAAVLLSIENADGNTVFENKKLSLFSFGNGYVSESLELTEGAYKLVQFLVLNADDSIIYASPMAGSDLAQYVTNPLPISFTVSKDASTTVSPQVLKVEPTDNPVSFGYANFGFEIVTKRLKQVIVNDVDPYNFTFYYDGEGRVIKTERKYLSESTPLLYVLYTYSSGGLLIKSEHYQAADLIETQSFEYNTSGQLVHVAGNHDEELSYSDAGLLVEAKIVPGYFSHHETAVYVYDENKNILKIVIHGYNEFNEEKWATTEKYYFDHDPSLSGNRAVSFYQGAISYVLPDVNYFCQVSLTNNPVKLEYSTYSDWMGNNLPAVYTMYSAYEYNSLGLPIKEVVHNPSLNAYYPSDGVVKEFIYE